MGGCSLPFLPFRGPWRVVQTPATGGQGEVMTIPPASRLAWGQTEQATLPLGGRADANKPALPHLQPLWASMY